jgi:uncharacterized protein (DUF1800 family)
MTSAEWTAMARLLRRTGFGTTGAAVDAALPAGPTAYVRSIVQADSKADPGVRTTPLPAFAGLSPLGSAASKAERAQRNQQIAAQLLSLTTWWFRRMVAAETPSIEKLTFCWHNHFATAASKVRDARWLATQNETLRASGRGDFRTLALAMLTDAAMLRWLDGEQNTSGAPNENLSREFMELFALGHGGGYTETDVREGARALTGWRINTDGTTRLVPRLHDAGLKTVLGATGNFDQVGFCNAVVAPAGSSRYLATRWWGQLVSDSPPPSSVVDRLVGSYGPSRSMSAMFTTMLTCPEFTAAQGSLVINPVEWLVGAVRALKVPVTTESAATKLVAVLRALGQVPFDPPSVGGWPSGQAWLSTAAVDLRMQAAISLAGSGDLSAVRSVGVSTRLEATAYLLGIGGWSPSTAAALQAVRDDPVRLVAVALNAPEYLTN